MGSLSRTCRDSLVTRRRADAQYSLSRVAADHISRQITHASWHRMFELGSLSAEIPHPRHVGRHSAPTSACTCHSRTIRELLRLDRHSYVEHGGSCVPSSTRPPRARILLSTRPRSVLRPVWIADRLVGSLVCLQTHCLPEIPLMGPRYHLVESI